MAGCGFGYFEKSLGLLRRLPTDPFEGSIPVLLDPGLGDLRSRGDSFGFAIRAFGLGLFRGRIQGPR